MNHRKHTGKHRTSKASSSLPVPETPDPSWTPDFETETDGSESERDAEKERRLEKLKETLELLTPRKCAIVSYYFGLEDGMPHTLSETGVRFPWHGNPLSKQRVSQIVHEMKEMLKQKEAEAQANEPHPPDR